MFFHFDHLVEQSHAGTNQRSKAKLNVS